MKLLVFVILSLGFLSSVQAFVEADKEYHREGKVFSLFSVVSFKNDQCQSNIAASSTSGTDRQFRYGTCFTSSECQNGGGMAGGKCAAGFGICCVFMTSTCGNTVNRNCSYIKNPLHPNPYNETKDCNFNVEKVSKDICHLRLDFEQFSILGPAQTIEATSAANPCRDSLMISSGSEVPIICGQNTGQHLYLDVFADNSDATLEFSFDDTASTGTRVWDIKVTQIACNAEAKPPGGCLQFHEGVSGQLKTFNFEESTTNGGGLHLYNQRYTVCIRREIGFCCIAYRPCTDSNSFTFNNGPDGTGTFSEAYQDSDCNQDFIEITGSNAAGGTLPLVRSRYCGGKFSTARQGLLTEIIRDCSPPFEVSIRSDDAVDTNVIPAGNAVLKNRGICLDYTQEPC